jgi:hypothetical protein
MEEFQEVKTQFHAVRASDGSSQSPGTLTLKLYVEASAPVGSFKPLIPNRPLYVIFIHQEQKESNDV